MPGIGWNDTRRSSEPTCHPVSSRTSWAAVSARSSPRGDDPAGQLPAPVICSEPVPPHHQHPVGIVQYDRQRDPLQPDDVMLEPLPPGVSISASTSCTYLLS